MNRTDRLHAIHEALRRAGRAGLTAAQLAEDLEVSTRTIKRDVDALQQAGSPIWAQHGPGGGYRLDAQATLPPVAFTPAQAVAAAVALAVVPAGSPFTVDARAAAHKVLDTLGPVARDRAEALAGRIWVLHNDGRAGRRSTGVLRALERSLVENLVVSITYQGKGTDQGQGQATSRMVEPIILAWTFGRWYLVAHCRLRDDIRWFRLDRISKANCRREPYQPRPVADIGQPPLEAGPLSARR